MSSRIRLDPVYVLMKMVQVKIRSEIEELEGRLSADISNEERNELESKREYLANPSRVPTLEEHEASWNKIAALHGYRV
jgi:hypothetical protein